MVRWAALCRTRARWGGSRSRTCRRRPTRWGTRASRCSTHTADAGERESSGDCIVLARTRSGRRGAPARPGRDRCRGNAVPRVYRRRGDWRRIGGRWRERRPTPDLVDPGARAVLRDRGVRQIPRIVLHHVSFRHTGVDDSGSGQQADIPSVNTAATTGRSESKARMTRPCHAPFERSRDAQIRQH